jgi:hypothetical protein
MQTYRCRQCGQVLAAFVVAVPGIALPFSRQAANTQLEVARDRHRDRCPGRPPQDAEEATATAKEEARKASGVAVRPASPRPRTI